MEVDLCKNNSFSFFEKDIKQQFFLSDIKMKYILIYIKKYYTQ